MVSNNKGSQDTLKIHTQIPFVKNDQVHKDKSWIEENDKSAYACSNQVRSSA